MSPRRPGSGGPDARRASGAGPEAPARVLESDALRALMDTAPDGLIVSNEAGEILHASEAACTLLGYAPDALVGKPVEALIPERLRGAHVGHRQRYGHAPRSRPMAHGLEFVVLRADGSELAVALSLSPLRRGAELLFAVGLRDLSERKRAAEQQRDLARVVAEKEQLSATLRSIVDGVITTDERGRVVFLNPVAEALTGWSGAQARGAPLGDVLRLTDRAGERIEPDVAQVIATGEAAPAPGEAVLLDPHGGEHPVTHSTSPVRDPGDRVVGAVVVLRDTAESDRMAHELHKASKLESVGVLAGGIAHDFNNLLTGILAHVALGRLEAEEGRPATRHLLQAEHAALRARDLTHQLLTFAKGGEPIRRLTSMRTLLRDSVAFILTGSTVVAHVNLAPELWPAVVDPGQVAQVIQNLVLNARQATAEGGNIRVTAENAEVEPGSLPVRGGRYVRISVEDDGPGIPEGDLERIFDPFFTTKPTGTGLGLTTSYAIARKHDGHIAVRSEQGRGAAFSLYLPAAAVTEPLEEPAPPVRPGRGDVLVMDDEPFMREGLHGLLRTLGYRVTTTSTGEEAVERYRERLQSGRAYDAVILDLTVRGGMGGQRTVLALRVLDPQVRAIVSSGYSDDPVMANHRAYGFAAVVPKPFTLSELSAVLDDLLGDEAR